VLGSVEDDVHAEDERGALEVSEDGGLAGAGGSEEEGDASGLERNVGGFVLLGMWRRAFEGGAERGGGLSGAGRVGVVRVVLRPISGAVDAESVHGSGVPCRVLSDPVRTGPGCVLRAGSCGVVGALRTRWGQCSLRGAHREAVVFGEATSRLVARSRRDWRSASSSSS